MSVKESSKSEPLGALSAPSGYCQWDKVSHKMTSGLQKEWRSTPSLIEDYQSLRGNSYYFNVGFLNDRCNDMDPL